jgi:hypothetical protein
LLLDFLDFSYAYPAKALPIQLQNFLRATAAPRAGRAWPRRFADGLGRLGHSRCRNDVFPADHFSERDKAIGYLLQVLTRSLLWLTPPGIKIFPAGSFTWRNYGLRDMKVT